ncbi:MAG: adenine phosphoribosyltransferase [Rhodospirillales bacterium]
MTDLKLLKDRIRTVPDFPRQGIQFRDITTLLKDPRDFHAAIDALAAAVDGQTIRKVAGIEARGFILGAALADRLDAGFVPVRKPGKLPAAAARQAYELEYGSDQVEIHLDAVEPDEPVLLVDDLLATGGTAAATLALLRQVKAEVVGALFLVELPALGGRDRLHGVTVSSLIRFAGD